MLQSLMNSANSLTHGWSGLVCGYVAAGAPMLTALIRERAPMHKLLRAPVTAIPVTFAAGVCNGLLGSVWHGLGASTDGLFALVAGVGVTAAVGYLSGRAIAHHNSDSATVKRGTVIDEIEAGLPHSRSRANEIGRAHV